MRARKKGFLYVLSSVCNVNNCNSMLTEWFPCKSYMVQDCVLIKNGKTKSQEWPWQTSHDSKEQWPVIFIKEVNIIRLYITVSYIFTYMYPNTHELHPSNYLFWHNVLLKAILTTYANSYLQFNSDFKSMEKPPQVFKPLRCVLFNIHTFINQLEFPNVVYYILAAQSHRMLSSFRTLLNALE